ncbi:hypothetical protein TMatcc_010405 [Talaromyces marneffei ATCC 18224]|uniref:Uncharacterized protein n=2 Tax=Talaromyces marneffei TaxID=37727 RepID=B6QVP5_TALMQ|nr:uncharacterized protein EYB26_009802 [Talaromyces marneffei]EEA19050.1 conserved hypothetical protein [Talaromyces marneffei ATCC 18224]KAE8548745.1 hypothetical protein EYB25_009126 [Talaromyces marneffei]QGA22088.1 hypothetical protein EYB26_009802 [Talaromyces marneffei]
MSATEETKPAAQEAPIVSHGRGGQGNIGADPTVYVDGEIVRSGPTGDQGDGAYSAGRGGAGNIGSPHVRPSTPGVVHDNVVVPETAVRESLDGDYHTGRGGQGNVHLDESHENDKNKHKHTASTSSIGKAPAGTAADGKVYEGLADKLKRKIFGR